MNTRYLWVTPPGDMTITGIATGLIVWPEENRLDIELDIFQQLKAGKEYCNESRDQTLPSQQYLHRWMATIG
jgi:hypothetical protein